MVVAAIECLVNLLDEAAVTESDRAQTRDLETRVRDVAAGRDGSDPTG